MQVDTRPDTMSNIASYYQVSSQKLQRHYKKKVSGFKDWNQLSHAQDFLIYPENITDRLSIDEVSLSKGELYTFVTNKNTKYLSGNNLYNFWHDCIVPFSVKIAFLNINSS